MAGTVSGRRHIANDTVARTPSIIASTPGASADATFYKVAASCPVLDHSSRPQSLHGPSQVKVINTDSFTAARTIIRKDPTAARKVAVLNLASDECPGGGWIVTLSRTQVYLFNASGSRDIEFK
jgi:Microbial-type PARG, catalytic domain